MGTDKKLSTRYRKMGFIWGQRPSPAAELAKKYIVEDQIKRVLDFGCGYGRDSFYYARNGLSVSGIDPLPEALELGKDWADSEDLSVDFRAESLPGTSFEPDSFDLASSFNAWQFLSEEEAKAAVAELGRILKPLGLLIIVTFSLEEMNQRPAKRISERVVYFDAATKPIRLYNREELRELFSDWNVIQIKSLDVCEDHEGGPHIHKELAVVARRTG